eukprot:6212953-Pleurochrysis_carterae.AAC.1
MKPSNHSSAMAVCPTAVASIFICPHRDPQPCHIRCCSRREALVAPAIEPHAVERPSRPIANTLAAMVPGVARLALGPCAVSAVAAGSDALHARGAASPGADQCAAPVSCPAAAPDVA